MFRKFLAGLIFSLFTVLFVPVSLAFGISTTFLDQNFYKGDFVQLVYEFALDELPRNANLTELPLSKEELKQILFEVFSKEDVAFMVESFFDQLKDVTVPDDGVVKFAINLDWLAQKNELISEKVAFALVNDLPACDTDNPPSEKFPKCLPADVSKVDFQNRIEQTLDRELFSNVPSEISFNFTFPRPISGNVFNYFNSIVVKILTIGFFVLVFLLGLMSLIIFSPWNRIGKWLSRAIFFASLNVFLLLTLLLIVPTDVFSDYGIDSYLRIYSFFVGALTSTMFYYIFPLMIFSFITWIGLIIYERKFLKLKPHESL